MRMKTERSKVSLRILRIGFGNVLFTNVIKLIKIRKSELPVFLWILQ